MRKILFCLLLITINVSLFANYVKISKAEKVAINFAKRHSNLQIFKSSNLKILKFNNDTVGYIFILNPKGFIIVSADDDVYPVLGYSFSNNWVEGNRQLPEGLKDMIDIYSNQISLTRQQKSKFNNPSIKEAWNNLSDDSYKYDKSNSKTVGPLLMCEWDQGTYYNQDCPVDTSGPGGHALVGCVAIATAQVMDYFKYPPQGQGKYSYVCQPYGVVGANFGNSTYDWNSMPNYITNSNPALAQLVYQCGIAVQMNYGPDGSSASPGNLTYAMPAYFKYSDSIQDVQRWAFSDMDWANMIRGNLDRNLPVIYAGSDPTQGGHCFVCDGYQDTTHFHFNWGWSGSCDGYYYLSNLNPGGYAFNNGQECLINIFPPSTVYPYYCKGKTTLTATNGVFDNGSAQKNYLNNSDCRWLIAPPDIRNISLTFDRFNTQLNKDIVTVYDGDSITSPVIAKFSGEDTIIRTAQSKGNKMLVRFQTNNNVTEHGWSASYTCSPKLYCSGLKTLTAPSDTFSDGSGGHFYGHNENCQWLIKPAYAKTIKLHFTSFDTEKNKDLVKVIDPTTSTPTLLATFSGSSMPADVTAYNGQMLVMFTTTSDIQHQGWSAQYSSTIGINELSNPYSLSVSVYPNPASTSFNIEIASDYQSAIINYQLTIINTLGQIIYTKQISDSKFTIQNLEFPKGIYTLTMRSNSGIFSRKLVIN